jgi:hypothetical protein
VEVVLLVFLAQKSRRDCCLFSGELAHFPRQSYNTFWDKNSGCCFGMNFEGNRTAKGHRIRGADLCICTGNSGMNFEEYLAQILRRKLGMVFEISL